MGRGHGQAHRYVTKMLRQDFPIYQRQPDEPVASFHAYQHYRSSTNGKRSVQRAWHEHQRQCLERETVTEVPPSWTKWATEWSWVARAGAWDSENDRVTTVVALAQAETWARAQVDFRERWRGDMQNLYGKLVERINKMLDFPLEEVTETEEIDEGTQIIVRTVIRTPVRWRLADVPRFVAAAQLLGTTVAGSPQDVPTEEEWVKTWAEREGIPHEQALSYYRRINSAMKREAVGTTR